MGFRWLPGSAVFSTGKSRGLLASETVQFDTGVDIITPENIAFQYRLAGPFRRIWAYLIDFAIRMVIVTGVWIGLLIFFGAMSLQGIGIGIALLISFVL